MKINKKKIIRKVKPYLFIAPICILMISLLAYPILYNMGISLFDWNLAHKEINFIGLQNYFTLFKSDYIVEVLINTLVWTGLGVSLQMLIGMGSALLIHNMRSMRNIMQTIVLMPMVLPGVIVSLMFAWILQPDLGIANHLLFKLGIIEKNIWWLSTEKYALFSVIGINTWKAYLFWFLMITAGLQNLPKDQIEAAQIDGAKYISILKNVIIPHLSPVIAATGVLTTIWTLNFFDLIWVTTKGGPLYATTTLPVMTYRLGFEFFRYSESAAMAVITLAIIMIVSLPYLRITMKNLLRGNN